MTRTRIVFLLVCTTLAAGFAPALAGWNQNQNGATARTAATSMPTGNTPVVQMQGNNATVSWPGNAFAGGAAVNGYVVRRYDANDAVQTIGAGCAGTITAVTCTESNVPDGAWKWSVQPKQHNWLGAEGAKSAAATVATSVYKPTILATSPAPSMYYRLGDATASATAVDSSGNNRPGVYAAAGVTRGVAGGIVGDGDTAVTGAGPDAIATVPTNAGVPSGTTAYSIEAWFKTTSTNALTIAGWGNTTNSDVLGVFNGNRVQFGVGGTTTNEFATPVDYATDGLWHHVVATYGSNTVRIYFDGVLIGTQAGVTKSAAAGSAFLIGAAPQGRPWMGDLDEVAMYPGVLSASQVASHFTASANSSPLPAAPTGVVDATGGFFFQRANVKWNPVTMPSGRPAVTNYMVTMYRNGALYATVDVPAPDTSGGLGNLEAGNYSFTVAAINAYGVSSATSSPTYAVSSTTNSYFSLVRRDGASLFYRLDEPAGPAFAPIAGRDYSGNGRDGVYGATGLTRNQPGELGDAAVMSAGTSDVLVVASNPNIPSGTQAHTVEGWFQTTSTAASYVAGWGSTTNWDRLGVFGGNQVEWGIGGASANSVTVPTYTDGYWHHVARAYDGVNERVYFDGVLVAARAATLDTPSTTPLRIGGTPTGGKFTGTLDEVAVYPSALSGIAIKEHFDRMGTPYYKTPEYGPATVAVTTGTNTATVTWAAAEAWYSPITSYTVTAMNRDYQSMSAVTVGASIRTATFTELNGEYRFQVTPNNFYGGGQWSYSDLVTIGGTAWSYASEVRSDGPRRYYRLGDVIGDGLAAASGTSGGLRYSAVSPTFLSVAPGAMTGDSDRSVTSTRWAPIAYGDGTDQLPSGSDERTIEAWIKPTRSAKQAIAAWGDKAGGQDSIFAMRNSTTLEFHNGTSTVMTASTTNLTNGSWHHVVFTYTAGTARIYVDGALRSTQTNVSLNTAPNTRLYLGSDDLSEHYEGGMDEVAIYDYGLTATQISAHYAART